MVSDDSTRTFGHLETEQGDAPESGRRRASLVLYHRDGVKVIPLSPGVPVVIGRAWPADAVVRDLKLSRRHAQFLWADHGAADAVEAAEAGAAVVTVEDLGSTNGTRLNGRPIQRATVAPGDEVSLGAVTVSLHLLSAREEAALALDGHDRFSTRLGEEVLRARAFGRPLAVLMVRAVGEGAHVRHILPVVREALRPVDLLGLYGPSTLMVALPETGGEAALAVAERIELSPGEVRIGAAAFPGSATSAEELVAAASEAVRRASAEAPVRGAPLEGLEPPAAAAPDVIVVAPVMRALYETVRRVARSVAPVLVVGETGTGKELVARALHEQSGARAVRPLRCLNCGAIAPTLIESTLFGHERGAFTGADRRRAGLFEEADGGTVFLDEVGELTPAAQAALLRVLETKRLTRVGSAEEITVDLRIVAATHRDLEALCESGGFRLDLLYRLNTITLAVPPLRERREEIAPLATLFAREAARANELPERRLEPTAIEALRAHEWPGNVRELRNVIERAVVICLGESITVEDLPERLRGGGGAHPSRPPETTGDEAAGLEFKDRVRQYETELILDALRRAEGNQTKAAKLLRMPLRTLVHKIKTYGIQKTYSSS